MCEDAKRCPLVEAPDGAVKNAKQKNPAVTRSARRHRENWLKKASLTHPSLATHGPRGDEGDGGAGWGKTRRPILNPTLTAPRHRGTGKKPSAP